MPLKHFMFPSAGSLSMAIMAAFIFILQIWFSTKRAEFRWYRWAAAISFSTILYAVGILLEYNAPEGPVNRFGGRLEWTAVIFLVHALYGFFFSRLNIPSRRYHFAAGGLHVLILILLWSTNIFVSDHFVARRFLTLEKPFVEPDLGPLGPAFMLYALGASINAIRLWIVKGKEKETYSRAYVWGASFWILLGIHDAACAVGFLSFQYVMEYGFLIFSAALFYNMFSDYLRTSDALDRSNAMLEKELEMRKQLADALRESKERYRGLIKDAPIGIFILDLEGRFVYGNRKIQEMTGYKAEEWQGKEYTPIVYPDDLSIVQEQIRKGLRGQKILGPYEIRIINAEGDILRVLLVSRNIYEAKNGKQELCGIQTFVLDISKRRWAEEALKESELKFRLVTESIKDVFWMSTYGVGEMVYISPAYEILWERSRESLYQSPRSFLEAIHNGDLEGYLGVLDEFHKNGKPYECEYRIIRRDREIRWIHEKGYSVPHSWHGSKVMAGVCTDITERKLAEEALQRSEASHKEAQRVAHIGHWELAPDIGTPVWSEEIFRIFGLDPDEEEPPFTEHEKYVHPEDWPILDKAVRKAGREGTPFDLVFRIVKPDGEMGWMHVIGTTLMDDEGNVTKLFGTAQDITALRRAEETLVKREKELRLIADNVPALVSYVDGDGYYRFVNKKYEEWFAIPQKEIVGQYYGTVLGEDTYELIKEKVKATLSGQRVRFEEALPYKHRGKRYVIADYVPDTDEYGKVKGFFALVTDITDRKQAEEALREKSLQCQHIADELELIIDAIPGLVFFKDTENRFIRVNKFVADAHQRTKKQLEGVSCFELYPREIATAYYEDDLEVIRNRRPKLNIDEPWETEYGTRWVNTSKIPYLNEKEEVVGVLGLSLDITERKEAEDALRESEEKYRSLVESTEDSIYLVDREYRYLFINKMHLSRFGLKASEVIGRRYDDFHSKKETKEFKAWANEVIKTGKSNRYIYQSERVGGHYLRTLSPVKDLHGNIASLTVVSKDITELMQAEEDLKKANEELSREHNQRKILSKRLIDLLERDRRQVAMELHDNIGQILTSLKMEIEMVQGKLKPEQKEFGALITTAQERTIQAIRDVKNISRGLRPSMLEALGLVPSIRELFNEIKQQTDIQIHFFSRNVPKKFDNEKELAIFRIAQEAISNIVKHAEAGKVFVNLIKKDDKLSLSVEDDGIGFDQKKVRKITKKEMPLGLLIIQERAEQLKGEFTLESQPGKGTHLLVEIPI